MTNKGDRDEARIDGAALMTVGAMIALLCGACTWTQWNAPDSYGLAPFVGGIPTLGGVVIFVVGLTRYLKSDAS